MADADVSVSVCDKSFLETKNNESNTNIKAVISTVKEIKNRKKKADIDSIITERADINPEEIKIILKNLCEENILKVSNRTRSASYLFVNNEKTNMGGLNETHKDNETQTIFNAESETNFDLSDVNLFEKEVENSMNFEILKEFIKVTNNLKEYVSYEIDKLKNSVSNVIIGQLKEENNYLKEKKCSEWCDVDVRNGPQGNVVKIKDTIKRSNRFNGLINEEITILQTSENNDVNEVTIRDTPKKTINKVTTKRRPNPVINKHPEKNTNFGGNNEMTSNHRNKKRKIRIISDSITKGIRVHEFNQYLQGGYAKLKCFPGSTIQNLNYYSNPTLIEEKPEVVVIHVGINNLLSQNLNETSDEEQLVNEIIDIGRKCIDHGTEKVFISSILKCSRIIPDRIRNVNELLKGKCIEFGFIYIDNNMIMIDHLWKDGIHLTNQGKTLLARHFINSLITFLYQFPDRTLMT